ncbi:MULTISPECIES: hypothetical protein [unclassified Clostridium]|uniref:hypothetical protein n=1 Tax=unclassified Clostridium TaxID=2614128 RepID=UPI0025BC90F0|nr:MULTISPECIES: hypothetical protein [unclassified Clostridium]
MQLKIERDVKNNRFETIISFENYGGTDITAEDEKELLENYPCMISYKDLTFSGKFNIKDKEVVLDESDNGETVTLTVMDKVFPLTENFQAKYEINIKDILDSELQTKLNTKELICQAKILLFEEKIVEKIKELIVDLKAKDNNFEKASPIHITI